MIYCVDFAQVERYLHDIGFIREGQEEPFIIYVRADVIVMLHEPNHRGDVTLASVESAFNAAGIAPPKVDPHWCD